MIALVYRVFFYAEKIFKKFRCNRWRYNEMKLYFRCNHEGYNIGDQYYVTIFKTVQQKFKGGNKHDTNWKSIRTY